MEHQLYNSAPDLKLLTMYYRVKTSHLGDGIKQCEVSPEMRDTQIPQHPRGGRGPLGLERKGVPRGIFKEEQA